MSESGFHLRLEDVYEQYKDMVYRLAKLRMRQVCDAEDVFQDVFVRLANHISDFRDEEHLKAWLIRVTINCCNSFFRSGWFRHNISLQDNLSGTDGDVGDYAQDLANLESSYDDVAVRQSVYEAVRTLPDKDREVIYLFYYEEMSIRDISAALRQTEGAVKTRLSRARKKLESKLRQE